MTTSRKSLLSAQFSGSGSSVSSDIERNSPSPLSMIGSMGEEEPHQYANPQELKKDVDLELDKIDSRKKKNLLYEPLPLSDKHNGHVKEYRSDSLEHPDVQLKQKHILNNGLYKFLFIAMFLMSLGAFILSVLTSFGVITARNECGCITEPVQQNAQMAMSQNPLTNIDIIHNLQMNISTLNNVVIPSLLRQVSHLQSRMDNESFHGEEGPQGPRGPAGPPGAGDLSQCGYRTEAITTSYATASPEKYAEISTNRVQAKEGNIILGASCTSYGGSQHGLFQTKIRGKENYYCKCAGKAITVAFESESLQCRIHVWECPITS